MAYLRGYLKPDQPQGLRSILRENLVLTALSQEMESEHLYHDGVARAVIATRANAMNWPAAATDAMSKIDLARKAAELYSERKAKEHLKKSSEGLVELFHHLESSGFFENDD